VAADALLALAPTRAAGKEASITLTDGTTHSALFEFAR
jgi:hypothetical protein